MKSLSIHERIIIAMSIGSSLCLAVSIFTNNALVFITGFITAILAALYWILYEWFIINENKFDKCEH